MNVHKQTFQYGPHTVTLETGRLARQASGSVLVSMGDTKTRYTITTINDNVVEVEKILAKAFPGKLQTYHVEVRDIAPIPAAEQASTRGADWLDPWRQRLIALPSPANYVALLQQPGGETASEPAETTEPAQSDEQPAPPAAEQSTPPPASAESTSPAPADAASHQLLKEQVMDVLNSLTTRERKVLEMRFGLEDGRSRTLEEVGREFAVTRERIRQIEAKALRKLRHPSRSKKLKDYLE